MHCMLTARFGRTFGVGLFTLALSALADLTVSGTASGATPAAAPKLMFDKSNLVGIDNAVKAYGVPVTNAGGVVIYYDLTIGFTPAGDGNVPTTAKVTAARSPVVSTRGIVAGQYNDAPGFNASCTVTNYAPQTGRTQSFVICLDDAGRRLDITLVNGAVNTGHPYYAQLHNAGIDRRTDVANYIWGIPTLPSYNGQLGGCGYFDRISHVVGAQQVGTMLRLSLFDPSGNFACTGGLTKVR